ncbi:uncharacterized protein Dwil_GK14730 [Drosophila willistoni]|uniref:SCP domain-containing protein n=1 Tax=Drosophila willistoni TaxID=7260 RepID=B4NPQ0_DROWI|nr:uncharacterized protein Dwil_GK14730 [Drosophila willistoni]
MWLLSVLLLSYLAKPNLSITLDYCARSLCGRRQHIACNNLGAWSSACPRSPSEPLAINFNEVHRNQILLGHNVRRNQIAGGNLNGYRSARRMATMRWDNELAQLALLNVRQCEMRHDACRNTDTFRASGQNLAIYGYSGARSRRTIAQLINISLEMWWNEYRDANMNIINRYPSNHSGPQIGHFTAMAQASNTHCGCAAAVFIRNSMNWFLLACNYATTNWISV